MAPSLTKVLMLAAAAVLLLVPSGLEIPHASAQLPLPQSASYCQTPVIVNGQPVPEEPVCISAYAGPPQPSDTQCDDVTCSRVRLDDGGAPGNVLDTDASGAPITPAADNLYWGADRVLTTTDSSSFLGATAKAADSDKLDGIDSNGFLRTSGGVRMVMGKVAADGSVLAGSGFTVSHFRTGGYLVTFSTAFSGLPTVVGTLENTGTNGQVVVESSSAASIQLGTSNASGSSIDSVFNFLAIAG